MAKLHGSLIWYELSTSDSKAAAAFYAEVVGWTISDFSGVTEYRILSAGDTAVVGVMTRMPGMTAGWNMYVGVEDIDAALDGIVAAGGTVRMPVTDLAKVGRIAMVADPHGVGFYIMQGSEAATTDAFHPTADGRCGWNELASRDLAAATAFYTEQFGWTKGGVMNMGELGDYQFIDHDGATIGAMMQSAAGGPPPGWNFYFRVPDIDAAAARIVAAGGSIRQGPMEVPGEDFIIMGDDPQGMGFALVGSRR